MLIWAILIIVPLLFGFYAQMRVTSAYNRNVRIPSRGHISGREAAAAVMESAGIRDVEIIRVPGQLTDHYDPSKKRLALSEHNYDGTSLAALGVAAHEAGHAIQDSRRWWPMRARQTFVPAATVGSRFWFFPVVAGFLLQSTGLVTVGLVLFLAVVLFQLVTLPVEFDASNRALAALERGGLLERDELTGARKVLNAAALTYVAGFAAALGQLVYFFIASR